MSAPALYLASTSPYRRQLLGKLQLAFETAAPECDETPRPGESAGALVERLARTKAGSIAARLDTGLVVGSDQVADLDGRILEKPGAHERAREQLRACSGRTVVFRTGLALVDAASGSVHVEHVDYAVVFRPLADEEIERYLAIEAPYDCAGSIRSEGYAVCLFERMVGDDPNALIGLPLIRLAALLREHGVPLP